MTLIVNITLIISLRNMPNSQTTHSQSNVCQELIFVAAGNQNDCRVFAPKGACIYLHTRKKKFHLFVNWHAKTQKRAQVDV